MNCDCTGTSPTRKRRPTRTTVPRAETPRPDYGIPSAFYVCEPRAGSSRNANQNARSYPRTQIAEALDIAYPLALLRRNITAANGRVYPTRFYARGPDAANFQIPENDRRINVNRLMEFPLLRNEFGVFVGFREGLEQGPDRVVFDGRTGRFAGVFTHRGEEDNRFHRALGHDAEVNRPTIPLDFPPTIVVADPFGYPWFGGGIDSFPSKRSGPANDSGSAASAPAPANFPLSKDGCPTESGQCYCYNTVTILGWFPREAGLQAIDQACNDWKSQRVPYTKSLNDIKTLSATKKINYNGKDWTIDMSFWTEVPKKLPLGEFPVKQKDCVTALRSAMDNCQTADVERKIGGQYLLKVGNLGTRQFVIHPGVGNPGL
ncbi:hypothetical protein CKM354_001123100 [Cercospora kikuchii]|uniref:Uncharacterized protein n=1 Tax=Cercospora kikuchii TaxID=84275 RepID=A0A9P3CSK7_9PEZI|nr:uncharacterized protein CKM354_001123100 [Cercospora kikuchii]GIZ48158.1 hypothetical protein CKM354_001123100 [Cercospora kikuchii]